MTNRYIVLTVLSLYKRKIRKLRVRGFFYFYSSSSTAKSITGREKFGFIQFFVSAIGIVSFSAMLYIAPQKTLLPGSLTLAGILMFLFQMFMTLKVQNKSDHYHKEAKEKT
nr:hypothetical protein [Neobacillus sp. Marseille-Q6967]